MGLENDRAKKRKSQKKSRAMRGDFDNKDFVTNFHERLDSNIDLMTNMDAAEVTQTVVRSAVEATPSIAEEHSAPSDPRTMTLQVDSETQGSRRRGPEATCE